MRELSLRGILTLCLLGFLLPAWGQDPKITNTNYPKDANVSVGATVSFLVSATGTSLTYQWQHEGTNLPAATNNSLTLGNLTVAHAGGYMATITNAIGGFTNTRTAMLTVDPTFTQVAGGDLTTDTVGAYNACWIDYDGDGYLDVSVVPDEGQSKRTPLYHNEGDGTFRKITTNAIGQTYVWGYAHVWGDYDNDGKPDLFVPNIGKLNDMLFHNNGNGVFTRITTGHPVSDRAESCGGAWGDYDRDGFLDLFVPAGGCPGENDMLYRNNGDGTFRKMTAAEVGPIVSDLDYTYYAVWADVDNDGRSELSRSVAPACSGGTAAMTNELWHLDGEGKFYRMDIGEMKKGDGGITIATWADYDNDGFLDAVLWDKGQLTGLYHNLAGQGFTNIATSTFPTPITNGYPLFVGDYDNDGWQDLVLRDYSGTYPYFLYRNNGDGTFTSQYIGSPTSAGGWPIWGDYNNDGFLDIMMIFFPNTRNQLFRHNGNTNHWLKVKLDGRASNRSGIGAKVRVKATIGGRTFWQMREITCENALANQNGLLAHFGLGDATNVTTLRIEWPSGIVQELPNVIPNQHLTVVECQSYGGAVPAFSGATKDASGLQLSVTEPDAGKCYLLEASSDLVNWTKQMVRTSAGGTAQFTDPRATNYTRRFYRLQVP